MTQDHLLYIKSKLVNCIVKLKLLLTFTFMVEAAPVIIVDFVSLASIGAYGLLFCGTFSRCLCDCAIVAGSCGAVAEHP